MDRSSKQRINKDTVALNGTLFKWIIDIYRTFYHKGAKYTFFSNAHETFSKIEHMVRQKTGLNKFKTTEIISSIFSDHNGLKLENKLKKKAQNHSNTWRLNNMLLKNEWVGENQDGGLGRHTAPPRTTRTDRKSNGKEVRHQGNKKMNIHPDW